MAEVPIATVKRSPFALVAGILLRPRATFTHLRDHQPRAWWLPAILIIVCSLLPVFAARSAANRQAGGDMMPVPSAMSGEVMIEKGGGGVIEGGGMPQDGPTPASGMSLLKTGAKLLGTPLSWLLWGAALYLVSVFLGRSSGFKPMARLAIWAWLPYAVRSLIQAISIWTTGQTIANTGFAGYVVDSAATQLITPGPGKLALASILGRVDIFLIWNLVLLIVGLRAFTSLPRRKSILAVLIIWAVLALLGVIPSFVGGLFGSMGL